MWPPKLNAKEDTCLEEDPSTPTSLRERQDVKRRHDGDNEESSSPFKKRVCHEGIPKSERGENAHKDEWDPAAAARTLLSLGHSASAPPVSLCPESSPTPMLIDKMSPIRMKSTAPAPTAAVALAASHEKTAVGVTDETPLTPLSIAEICNGSPSATTDARPPSLPCPSSVASTAAAAVSSQIVAANQRGDPKPNHMLVVSTLEKVHVLVDDTPEEVLVDDTSPTDKGIGDTTCLCSSPSATPELIENYSKETEDDKNESAAREYPCESTLTVRCNNKHSSKNKGVSFEEKPPVPAINTNGQFKFAIKCKTRVEVLALLQKVCLGSYTSKGFDYQTNQTVRKALTYAQSSLEKRKDKLKASNISCERSRLHLSEACMKEKLLSIYVEANDIIASTRSVAYDFVQIHVTSLSHLIPSTVWSECDGLFCKVQWDVDPALETSKQVLKVNKHMPLLRRSRPLKPIQIKLTKSGRDARKTFTLDIFKVNREGHTTKLTRWSYTGEKILRELDRAEAGRSKKKFSLPRSSNLQEGSVTIEMRYLSHETKVKEKKKGIGNKISSLLDEIKKYQESTSKDGSTVDHNLGIGPTMNLLHAAICVGNASAVERLLDLQVCPSKQDHDLARHLSKSCATPEALKIDYILSVKRRQASATLP